MSPTVPNRPDPGDPYYDGTPPATTAQPSWIAAGLQRMAAGLNEALLFAAPARATEPMTREALFMLLARAIAAGAPAPRSVEFEMRSHGPELELTCADNDRTGVSLFAALFGLPLPRESGWIRRRGAQQVRSFGASSVRVNPADERDPGEPAGPRMFHGWVVAVHCLVDAEPQPAAAVGVAQVAPVTSEVPL